MDKQKNVAGCSNTPLPAVDMSSCKADISRVEMIHIFEKDGELYAIDVYYQLYSVEKRHNAPYSLTVVDKATREELIEYFKKIVQ